LADAAALQEPGHHSAGEPIAALARDRADQWIAVRRKSECAVYPFAHARGLQHGIAAVDEFELVGDAIDVFLQELDSIVPWSAVHRPMLRMRLIDADQHPLLVLAHIGES